MNARLLVGGCVALMSVALVSVESAQNARQPRPVPTPAARPQAVADAAEAAKQRALVDQYCVTCHNTRLKTANLLLDQLDLTHLGDHAEIGRKSRPEASGRHDAADGHAAAGSGHNGVADPLDGE